MIQFLTETTLTIVEGYDEATDNITEESVETFKTGEPVDADIVSEEETKDPVQGYVDLQFGGGGGVAFGVQRSCFEVIPDKSLTKPQESV
jgi:hypothetical protein